MAQRHNRRNFFINREYQGKVVLSTFLFFLLGSILFITLLALLSADTLTISYTDNSLHFGQTPLMLIKQIVTANWFLLAFGGLVLVLFSMKLSHRIAGPMYRFELALNRMNKGDLNDNIRLRIKDEGKDLAQKINQFNTTLSTSVRTLNHHTDAINTLVEQIESMQLLEEEKNQLASLCWSIRENNRKIQASFSHYTPKDN